MTKSQKLSLDGLKEALIEAITYSTCIMQAKTKEVAKIAKQCLRELLDSLVPDDNSWVVERLGEWLARLKAEAEAAA